jgi:nitrate/nitrite transporter NarK
VLVSLPAVFISKIDIRQLVSPILVFFGIMDRIHVEYSVATLMGVFSIAAIFSEVGNGANFALVPHCNPKNNASSSLFAALTRT